MGIFIILKNKHCSIQIRYGSYWAPVHPSFAPSGLLKEILLEANEELIGVNSYHGAIWDGLEFIRSSRTTALVGSPPSTVFGNRLVYFSGEQGRWNPADYGGVFRLTAYFDQCNEAGK